MNTNVVVVFHPFEIEQEIFVYQKGECVEQIHPTLATVVPAVCGLNNQYNIDRINLCGVPSFVNKYVKELKSNFSNMPTIEIISK